ncbi:MAG: hypothetical protein AAFP97_08260 [Pseudomonadota bacterium]
MALSSLSIGSPAMSQDTFDDVVSTDWTRSTYSVPVTDKANIDVEHVTAQKLDADGNPLAGSLGFACASGKLFVMLSYEDVDMDSAIKAAWSESNAKPTAGRLTIDGETSRRSGYTDMRDSQVFTIMTPGDRRSLYNGVIRGQDMSFKVSRKQHTIHVPSVNTDFREFGAECGLGTLSRSEG